MAAPRRIALLAAGTTGDILPILALSVGLQAAGWAPRLVSHAVYASLAARHGVPFVPVPDDPQAILSRGAGRDLLGSDSDPLAFALSLRRAFDAGAEAFLRASVPAAQEADLILASDLAIFMATSLGERFDVPVVPALLHPTDAAFGGANPFVSRLGPMRIQRAVSHVLFDRGARLLLRPAVNRARRAVLDLPPLPLRAGFPVHRPTPFRLFGCSPALVGRAGPPGGRLHVTGFWTLAPQAGDRVAEPLRSFVEAGEPPVCIGFGSMIERRPAVLFRTVAEAVRRSGRRAVLLGGWAGLADIADAADDSLFVTDQAPHAWLFPRCAVLVHHAGAGTCGAALRAGRPSVPVPYFGDQFFWADRLARLGAATAPLPRTWLSAERLAAAIGRAAVDPTLRAGARVMQARLAGEDGVGEAVAVMGAYRGREREA